MPKLLTTPFATDAPTELRTDIQVSTGAAPNSATYQQGFPANTMEPITAGGIPPKGSDFNGIFYDITDNLVFLTQGNGYPFDAAYATSIGGYPLNAHLRLNTGYEVKSTIANNSSDPNLDMSNWVPVSGFLNFDMFGINNTGSVAVDDEIRKVAEISTALKLPIHQFSGTYLLNGSSSITFTEDTMLDGSKFVLGANFSGQIICKRNDEVHEEITNGSFFDQVKAVGTLFKGQTFLNLGNNYQDHYMTFETTQPMYMYRGLLETAFLKTRHFREGRLQSAPFFNLDLSKLTKIRVSKANDFIRIFSGFCFDESNSGALLDYFKLIQSNMVVLRNIRYVNRGPERNSNQTRCTIEDCYKVVLDGLDTSSPHANPNGTFTYTLTLNDSYDLKIKNMLSQGRGWGTVGSNNCSLVKFYQCDVNRIDFHRACYEKLIIEDCRIGDFGIITTLVADAYMNNVQFMMQQGYGNRGFIRSNSDASGFCNGDLFMNNITINGFLSNSAPFFNCREGGEAIPVGSPLVQEFFTNIYIDGIHHNGISSTTSSLLTADTAGTSRNMLPKRIHLSNGTSDTSTTMFDIHVDKFSLRTGFIDIKYTNISTNTISFRDNLNIGTKARVKLLNVTNQNTLVATGIFNTANFDITLIGCDISKYSEFIGAWTTFLPKITVDGGSLTNTSDTQYFHLNTGVHNSRIKAINVDFTVGDLAFISLFYRYQPVSCWFNGLRYIPRFTGDGTSNTGSFQIDTRSGNLKLLLEHGTLRYETTLAPLAGTYTTANGATIVITVSSTTATITVNAAAMKTIGLSGII